MVSQFTLSIGCIHNVAADGAAHEAHVSDGGTEPVADELGTDERLLAALQERDAGALEQLYDRYGRLAYGLALRMVSDVTIAEDVVQDAFLNVWRQAPSFDHRRGAVRTWLLSIVHHRAVDMLRRRVNQRRDLNLDQVEQTLSLPEGWSTVENIAERETLRQALDQLPDDQRQTIELAYFAGYTQPEIATVMGVPLTTVKGRLRIAMQKLRTTLEGTPSWTTT